MSKTGAPFSKKTHQSWRAMNERCNNPNHRAYKHYGGRGVSVSSEWSDYKTFLNDMGEVPSGFQIDRIDTNGNYEKGNCKWSTRSENNKNRRAFCKSGYKGIYFSRNKYMVQITVDNKNYHIGNYKELSDAVSAINEVCMEWYGFIPKY